MKLMTWKSMVAVSLLAACSLVSIPAVSQGRGLPVTVVNGSGQPIPTAAQGTTNVAGTVSLASGSIVNIGNTPNVNVANTATVNVANTPTVSLAPGASVTVTNPLNGQNNPAPLVTLEAAQPYEDVCFINFSGNEQGSCNFTPIPAGKRLVIQEFDAAGTLEPGLKPLDLQLTPLDIRHFFVATFMGSGHGYDYFATHQETRIYVKSNETPYCYTAISGVSNSGQYLCQFSGFLVDVP